MSPGGSAADADKLPMLLNVYAPDGLDRLSDDELVDVTRNGSADACRAAFHALYNRHARRAWNYIRSASATQEEAEDRFVETWEIVSRKVAQLTLTGAFYSWVLGIARNVIRHAIARNRTRDDLSLEELIYGPDQADLTSLIDAVRGLDRSGDDAVAKVLKGEEAEILTEVVLPRLMDRYPVPCQVIILSYFAWLKDDEIAQELGTSIAAVRTARSRALRHYLPAILREVLDEMGETKGWFEGEA